MDKITKAKTSYTFNVSNNLVSKHKQTFNQEIQPWWLGGRADGNVQTQPNP